MVACYFLTPRQHKMTIRKTGFGCEKAPRGNHVAPHQWKDLLVTKCIYCGKVIERDHRRNSHWRNAA